MRRFKDLAYEALKLHVQVLVCSKHFETFSVFQPGVQVSLEVFIGASRAKREIVSFRVVLLLHTLELSDAAVR